MSRVVVSRSIDGQLPYFPSAIRLADGRVLAVWREGLGHVRSVGRIVAAESPDGRSWSEPRVIVDTLYDDRDPMVVQLRGGDILLSWFQIDWSVRPYVCPAVLVARSTDGGTTWGEPVLVGSGMVDHATSEVWRGFRAGHIVAHGQILELPNGDLLAPVYGVFPGDESHSASVVRSTDGGLSWPAEGEVVLGRKPGREYVEPVLTLLPGGQVVALLRTDEEAELVRSDDNGHTWTEPELCGLHASSADTLTLSDGAVLVAYGDVSGRFNAGRPTVATIVREPLGPWDKDPVHLVIDAGRNTLDQANPAVVELPGDELLIISYDIFTREIVGEILPRSVLQAAPPAV